MLKLFSIIILSALISVPSSSVFGQSEEGVEFIDIGSSALWVEIVDDRVYISNPADGKIAILDVNTNQIIDNIDAPTGIVVLEVVKEKNKIYASVADQNKIFVFDLTTHEKTNEIDIGEPELVLFSKADKPYGQREYTYFDTNAIGIKYNPNNQMLYAAHSQVNHINVIDTNSEIVVDTILVGKSPLLIEIDEKTNTGYVTNWGTNDVTVIDLNTNQVVDSLQTGFVPDQMELDQENNRLYVTHHASSHVTVIDLRDKSIEAKIQLKGPTHAIALDSKNNLLHVTYLPESGVTGPGFKDRVEYIDTNTNQHVGGFEINDNPFTIDIDSENQKLFASVIKSGQVVAVDLISDPRNVQLVEEQQEQAQATADGGCLIATATYGSELAPQVQLLRELRDNTILSTSSGASFMIGFNTIYYSFSPTIADWERESPVFKQVVKTTITPLLSSLTLLNYVDIDSESEMLGYGIGIILLNIGLYFVAPVIVILKLTRKF